MSMHAAAARAQEENHPAEATIFARYPGEARVAA